MGFGGRGPRKQETKEEERRRTGSGYRGASARGERGRLNLKQGMEWMEAGLRQGMDANATRTGMEEKRRIDGDEWAEMRFKAMEVRPPDTSCGRSSYR